MAYKESLITNRVFLDPCSFRLIFSSRRGQTALGLCIDMPDMPG